MSNSYNFSNRKLTDTQADEIRKRYFNSNVTQARLAREYDVSDATIQRILNNRYYKQLNPQRTK